MEGVRAQLDTVSALTWSLMKVKGDDWLAWLARSAVVIFAGLTSVSKGQTLELWHFSVYLDSSQIMLPITGHHNIRTSQVVKEERGASQKESFSSVKRQNALFSCLLGFFSCPH